MADEPINGSPVTVREVGIYLSAIRGDIEDLKTEMRAYILLHGEAHKGLEADVRMNTDWRKERMAYEKIARWLISSNLAALVGMVLAIIVFLKG